MTKLMTLSELIAVLAGNELTNYIKRKCYDYESEMSEDEMNKYFAGDYEIHLHYLIETWKNSVDEDIYNNFKIDYDRRGTFDELWKYFVGLHCPMFGHEWLDEVFASHILDTNVCLK